ncbi:MAG: AAA family ATPase [Actinomycetia bacterium]|nr:AAA family ATPase [Actinomycetes bacterium]
MSPIVLPNNALVLLVGISGAGKTTFAAAHFAAFETLSSDTCRALVADDENDQSANRAAFEVLHLILHERLRRGRFTVVDATNLHSQARQTLRGLASRWRIPVHVIVLNPGWAVCEERWRTRTDRHFERKVLQRQQDALRSTLEQLPNESYEAVTVLDSAASIAAATIVRR